MKSTIKHAILFYCIAFASFLIAQENPDTTVSHSADKLSAADIKKIQGQALFDSSIKKFEEAFDRDFGAALKVLKAEIGRLESLKERYEGDLRRSKLERLRFDPVAESIKSAKQANLGSQLDLVTKNLESANDQLKTIEGTTNGERINHAWKRMDYPTRAKIWESGCLSILDRSTLSVFNPVQNLSRVKKLTNSIGMELVEVPNGHVRMGNSKQGGTRKFFFSAPMVIGAKEVTQAEFKRVTGNNPSKLNASHLEKEKITDYSIDSCPVEHVTWYEAVRFCVELSKLKSEKDERRYYRLPTEWEWEYACRAKNANDFHFRGMTKFIGNEANLDFKNAGEKSIGRPTMSGWFTPNAFGLFDMHGNVSEWCGDWYDPNYFKECPDTNPPGPAKGKVDQVKDERSVIPPMPRYESKVHRGGDFRDGVTGNAACASRSLAEPDSRSWIGFRVVCENDSPSEIAKAQYQAMLDYENGKPRPDDHRLKEVYRTELLRRKALLESNKNDKLKADEEWHRIAIGSGSQHQDLQDLSAAIAHQYSPTEEGKLRLQAFLDAAKYGELALEDLKSRNADTSARIRKIIILAGYYESAEEPSRASAMIDKVLAVFPSHENALEIKRRLNKN